MAKVVKTKTPEHPVHACASKLELAIYVPALRKYTRYIPYVMWLSQHKTYLISSYHFHMVTSFCSIFIFSSSLLALGYQPHSCDILTIKKKSSLMLQIYVIPRTGQMISFHSTSESKQFLSLSRYIANACRVLLQILRSTTMFGLCLCKPQ